MIVAYPSKITLRIYWIMETSFRLNNPYGVSRIFIGSKLKKKLQVAILL